MRDVQVIELTPADVCWPFEDHNRPYVLIGGGKYPRRTFVDPFPGYAHDVGLVKEMADKVAALWPVPWEVRFYVLPYETESRSNGWAQLDPTGYDEKGKARSWVTSIALLGKRIPIHPAVTRYLVAHEYGHAVEDAIAYQQGTNPGGFDVSTDYAKLRGLEAWPTYGGGKWHLQATEVFANDFRLLVAKTETEFWPHPGLARPEDVPGLWDWWLKQRGAAELPPAGVKE